jgi:hypothetical protein
VSRFPERRRDGRWPATRQSPGRRSGAAAVGRRARWGDNRRLQTGSLAQGMVREPAKSQPLPDRHTIADLWSDLVHSDFRLPPGSSVSHPSGRQPSCQPPAPSAAGFAGWQTAWDYWVDAWQQSWWRRSTCRGYEEIDRLFDGLIGDAIGLVIVAVFARSSVCGPAVAVTRTGDQKWGA